VSRAARAHGSLGADVHARLDALYAAQLGRDHVARVVEEIAALSARARFLNYVPVLIEKMARDELRAATRATSESPKVHRADLASRG
jgi:hypothetical protein